MNDKLIDELRTQYNEMTEEPKITGAGYWAEHPKTGIISPEPNTITMVAGNRTLLTFHPDGRVDGDIADASEAARVFCETVSHLFGKTTPSQPATDKPEAVAWMYVWPDEFAQTDLGPERYPASYVERHNLTETPLYAHPPSQDASALVEAAKALASDVQDLIDCRGGCGEWGAECPLQDAGKPGSTMDRLQRLLDALTAWEAQHG